MPAKGKTGGTRTLPAADGYLHVFAGLVGLPRVETILAVHTNSSIKYKGLPWDVKVKKICHKCITDMTPMYFFESGGRSSGKAAGGAGEGH